MTELLTNDQIKRAYVKYMCNHKNEIEQLLSKKLKLLLNLQLIKHLQPVQATVVLKDGQENLFLA